MKKLVSLLTLVLLLGSTVLSASAAGFDIGSGATDVSVMNTSTTDQATVVAQYINQDGTTETTINQVIPPLGSVKLKASDAGLGDGWMGSMVLSSDVEIASVAETNWTGGASADGKTAGAYTGVAQGATEVFCAALYQRLGKQYSVLTVQNTDTDTASISIYYYDRDGNAYSGNPITDNIPAGAQRTYDLSTPGGNVPSLPIVSPPDDGWIGSVRVTGGGKQIAAVVTTHWVEGYSTMYNCAASGNTALYFPDVKRRYMQWADPGRTWEQWGGVVVQNLSADPAEVTTVWQDRQGNVLHTFTDTIPGYASHGYNTRWPANTPDSDAFFADLVNSEGNPDINLAMSIVSTNGKPLAGVWNGQSAAPWNPSDSRAGTYSGGGVGATDIYFPAVYRVLDGSNWVTFSALLVFNPSSTDAANVTVHWYDQSGTELFSFTDAVPAGSSHGYNTRWGAGTNTPDPDALHAALGNNFQGSVWVESDIPVIGISNIKQAEADAAYNAYAPATP